MSGRACDARIGLAGAIGADDGREVGIAEKEGMMSLVGLEVCTAPASAIAQQQCASVYTY